MEQLDIKGIVEFLEKQMEDIRALEPKDRLALIAACFRCNTYLQTVSQGWGSFLSNPTMATRIDEKELQLLFGKFRQVTMQFHELSLAATKRLLQNQP